MLKESLKGIYTAIITPFDKNGQLDIKSVNANVRRWNQYGLRGYVVSGSTGEAPLLSNVERKKLIKNVKESMSDGMTLLAGTGRETTAQTIETCNIAAEAGADAAVVVTPWYYKPLMTDTILEQHFTAVAEASQIPILLYNIPKFTGVSISLNNVIMLAQHPNIIGIKDSSGDTQRIATMVRKAPTDFAVFTGHAPTLAQTLMSGATGAILAIANLVPEVCVALYRASEAQNFSKVQELNNLLQAISEVSGGTYGIGGLKYAMSLLEYDAGSPRPPLLSPSKSQKQEIIVTLQKAGLLEGTD